jgi:hypothetical protein
MMRENEGAAENPWDMDVTPEMIEAGASVVFELAGEASPARLAETIFRAMSLARKYSCPEDSAKAKYSR